jgi:hypothetical protein
MTALYGPWDMSRRPEPFPYDDTASYRMAADFLDGPGIVGDWGAGGGWFGTYLTQATYLAVDGAPAPWINKVADLRTFQANVPRAMMRHVLEHNPEWEAILSGFLASFTDRAVIVTFVPFLGADCPHKPCHAESVEHGLGSGVFAAAHSVDPGWNGPPDLHLSRVHFEGMIVDAGVEFARPPTKIQNDSQYGGEEVFYLTKGTP